MGLYAHSSQCLAVVLAVNTNKLWILVNSCIKFKVIIKVQCTVIGEVAKYSEEEEIRATVFPENISNGTELTKMIMMLLFSFCFSNSLQ